jgi:hypothetical protein
MLENMSTGSESHERERVIVALAADAVFLSKFVEHYKVQVSAPSDSDMGKSGDLSRMYDGVKDVA